MSFLALLLRLSCVRVFRWFRSCLTPLPSHSSTLYVAASLVRGSFHSSYPSFLSFTLNQHHHHRHHATAITFTISPPFVRSWLTLLPDFHPPFQRVSILDRADTRPNDPVKEAQRRIKALDSMVRRLKQQRANCKADIERDMKELANIEGEEARILERSNPLKEKLKEEREDRDRINAQINQIQATFSGVISTTKSRVKTNMMADAGLRKTTATSQLRADRGFDGGKGSTLSTRRKSSRK